MKATCRSDHVNSGIPRGDIRMTLQAVRACSITVLFPSAFVLFPSLPSAPEYSLSPILVWEPSTGLKPIGADQVIKKSKWNGISAKSRPATWPIEVFTNTIGQTSLCMKSILYVLRYQCIQVYLLPGTILSAAAESRCDSWLTARTHDQCYLRLVRMRNSIHLLNIFTRLPVVATCAVPRQMASSHPSTDTGSDGGRREFGTGQGSATGTWRSRLETWCMYQRNHDNVKCFTAGRFRILVTFADRQTHQRVSFDFRNI